MTTPFDNTQAESEGWAIFDAGPWGYQIQRDDEMQVFATDVDAWRSVREKANAGSTYHQQALAWMQVNHPEEYAEVMAA